MMPLVRSATPADASGVHAIYAPVVEHTCISFELEPPSVTEIGERIQAVQEKYPYLVCEDDSRICGYAYASSFRARPAYQWTAEVSVYVAEATRGRGVGRLLYGRLLPLLEELGFHSLIAGIALPNAASVRLHEAFGFRPVGVMQAVGYKHGAWHDVGFWQRMLADETPGPKGQTPG